MERGLDPLKTNLVVADESRTEKTICLAVSPSLKAYGIGGRARLFEVVQKVKEVNARNPAQPLEYIVAPPRMALYIEYSTRIYDVYLKYVAPEDIHVYSIDEVFMDVTPYLRVNHMTPRDFARQMIQDVYETTKITATAGIGTNLYLAKVAMDIVAKHIEADSDGTRIAKLDEMSYRRLLWSHRPLTDFWRVGRGYAKKLENCGLYTMGDIARCSIGKPGEYYNEDLLYRMFGVNAELLIDHAWGRESCTMQDIKAYQPSVNSLGSGQVLTCPYSYEKARLIVREMMDLLVLDLVEKDLVSDQIVLTVGYDISNLTNPEIQRRYRGPFTTDHYGRKIPKGAHGSINLEEPSSSSRQMIEKVSELYDRIVNPDLLVRRVQISLNRVVKESSLKSTMQYEQMQLFVDYREKEKKDCERKQERERERKIQQAMLDIKKRYGKNAVLKGMNLEEGATAMERNQQIGGHKA